MNFWGIKQCLHRSRIQPEVVGSPDGIVAIFDRNPEGWIVFLIEKPGDAKHPVAIGASGITAKGYGEQLEGLLLPVEVETFDLPESLVLAGRRGQNRSRWRH